MEDLYVIIADVNKILAYITFLLEKFLFDIPLMLGHKEADASVKHTHFSCPLIEPLRSYHVFYKFMFYTECINLFLLNHNPLH